jgi:hypothetical protein
VEVHLAKPRQPSSYSAQGDFTVPGKVAAEKPSLVYVHARLPVKPTPRAELQLKGAQEEAPSPLPALPAGMRILVRLQSAINTAIATPVIALVEYNYEKDGVILMPAGTRLTGHWDQADRSGYVSLKFYSLQVPHGESVPINGIAQSLDYGPLKGRVEGKKNFARFATRALTGVGVAASQVVGLRGGLSGPVDNSILIRDRLATNVALAGDQQLQQLSLNSRILVTIPANTRFYVVLEKPAATPSHSEKMPQESVSRLAATPAETQAGLTKTELEELRTLKQEFSRLMLAAGSTSVQPAEP